MKIINWSFVTSEKIGIDHPECVEPLLPSDYNPFKNLSKEISSNRKGVTYLKCPAHTDFLKNTFVFCAPFDLTIDLEINQDNNLVQIYCPNISQEIFDSIIDTRMLFDHNRGKSPYPILGIDWLTIFTSRESMTMQWLPAFMHHTDFTEKTTVVPGEYDISKWTRPIELMFEIKKHKENIIIKKNDPIAYIKFLSEDVVKLTKECTPWNEIAECDEIVNANKFRPLKERYDALAEVRRKKCPYSSS